MRSHLTVRALIYGLAVVAAAAVVFLGLAIYRNGVTVPSAVLNWRVAQRLAARYGVRYSLDSLRIGCLTKRCPGDVNAGTLKVELNTAEPFRLQLSGAQWRRSAPITVAGLEIRSGDRPPLISAEGINANPSPLRLAVTGLRVGLSPGVPPAEIERVEFDGAAKRVVVNGIQVQRAERPPVTVEHIQAEGWNVPAPGEEIILDRAKVTGVMLSLDGGRATNATFCEELPSSAAIGRQAAAPFLPLLPFFKGAALKLRNDLLNVALALGGLLLILKFLSVLWLRRWASRLLLAPISILLTFALYFRFHAWPTGRLALVTGATLAALAVVLHLLIYRRGKKWYQRWEPVAADIAPIVILLPLFGYGYQFTPLPSAPQKLRLERLDVVNVAGRSTRGVRFDLPQTAVMGTRISLPDSVKQVLEVAISAIEIPTLGVVVSPSSSLTLRETHVDGVLATYDSGRMEVRDLFAHVRLAGLFESDVLQRELRNLEFLRGMEIHSSRVGFDLDLTASAPGAAPRISRQFLTRNPIGVNAGVVLNPVACTASYDLLARILTPSLKLAARADGDAQYVHLRELRSLPESSLAIASGSGNVTLGSPTSMSFNLGAIGGSVGPAQLSLASLGISGLLPPIGQSGKQELSLALGPAEIQTSDGLKIRFAQAGMRMGRELNSSRIPVTFQSRIEDVRLDRRNNGIIEADFPVVETTIEGNTTPEFIPNTFTGTASFKMSGAGKTGELLGLERPLSIGLDLWKGRLELMEQPVTLRGALLSAAASSIPIRAQLLGQLSSIEPQLKASLQAHAGIDHVDQTLGSGRVTVDDIRFDGNADWDDRGVSAKLNYATGWIEAQLAPPPPFALCLDEIATLDLIAQGKASRIPSFSSSQSASTTAPSTCGALPSFSPEARFRLSGAYPPSPQEFVLRMENASGKGIRVGNVGSEIRVLRIREGRLGETASRISATGIQNLQGLGGFDADVDLRRGGESLEATTSLSSGGGRLLEAAVTRRPDRITLDVTQDAPADRILDRLRPFLSDLDVNLDGITPQARIARLHAEANFAGDALQDMTAAAELAGGPIVSIDRPDLRVNVSTPSTVSGPALRFSVGKPQQTGASRSIVAVVDLPGSAVKATTNDGVALDVESKLRLDARGSLLETNRPPASPILQKLVDVGNGLNLEVSRLTGILGSQNAAATPMSNIDWKLSLSQRSPAQPLVRFTPNAIQVDGPSVSFNAAWNAGGVQERSTIAGSSELDTTIALVGDQVLVDALPSVQVAAALNGQPETRIATTLPIQVVFSDRLKEARLQADSLWDADYYGNFWHAHPSRFTGTEIVSPVDIGEATVGPLYIRQVLFPVEPIRALVGYKDALQLGLPFSGRALFGAVRGSLESNLASLTDTASLDVRLNIDLKGIQAGALGSTMGGGHSAFVEDELDGKTLLRLDGLTLDRNTMAALLKGNPDPDELRKIDMSVHLFRTPEKAYIPAVLQASSDLQVDLANELLNRIVNGVRLTGPPRALTYRDLDVKFDVERGLVRSDREILRLGRLQIFSADFVDVAGEVHAHLGRPGERILLRDMIQMLSGFTPVAEAEVR